MTKKLSGNLRIKDRLIVAVDLSRKEEIIKLCCKINNRVSTLKLGLEVIYSNGLDAIKSVKSFGYDVMLDVKLLDIPNTVSKAVRAITGLGVSKITVHSTGGKKMIGAAKQDAVNESENLKIKPPDIFAVTILTSLDDIDLHDIGYRGRYLETVENLAELAISGGADGIVCSPNEVTSLREKLGGDFFIATPGIRMTDNCSGDQKRFNTPFFAIKNGADYIIAGRPVTENADPESAVETILEDINKAL